MNYKFKTVLPYFITAASVFGPSSVRASEPNAAQNVDGKNTIENVRTDSVAQNDSVAVLDLTPRLTGFETRGKSVIYTYNDGTRIERKADGTRAWRNNNPGNLRYYQFAKNNGAIGEAGGFAVFPDEQTGMNALVALLMSNSYQRLTLSAALKRYDPTNYTRYVRQISHLTGLSGNTKLSSLTPEQIEILAQSIRRIEGWVVGTEAEVLSHIDVTKKVSPEIAQNMVQRTR